MRSQTAPSYEKAILPRAVGAPSVPGGVTAARGASVASIQVVWLVLTQTKVAYGR